MAVRPLVNYLKDNGGIDPNCLGCNFKFPQKIKPPKKCEEKVAV